MHVQVVSVFAIVYVIICKKHIHNRNVCSIDAVLIDSNGIVDSAQRLQ